MASTKAEFEGAAVVGRDGLTPSRFQPDPERIDATVGDLSWLRGIVAVIRSPSDQQALMLAKAFSKSGVSAIEITMTVPNAAEVIRTLQSERSCPIGAGTVTSLDQLHRCVDAGAQFIVSPHTDHVLIAEAVRLQVAAIPGALTPTEIVSAIHLGASAVKIFPISAVGGLDFLRSVRRPIPDCQFVVSGGISAEDVSAYLGAGALAVCLETRLFREADLTDADPERLRAFAASVVQQGGGPWV